MSLLSSSFSTFWFFIALASILLYHSCLADYKNSSINTSDDHILCIERERVALVQFKHDLVDPANRLVSWGNTNTNTNSKEHKADCCRWAGIVCDIYTGHVLQIHLRGHEHPTMTLEEKDIWEEYNWEEEYIWQLNHPSRLSGKINPSLLALENLMYLDISNNDFQGMQIPKFIGSLHNLRYLNLSYSGFYGEIPPQLGNLSSLNTIDLSFNPLSSDNLWWLTRLSMLHNLDMSFVDLSKASNWLHTINSLPSLVALRMSLCGLSNTSVNHIFSDNSSSLFLLDLSYNPDLAGIVFHNMTSLRKLDVSGNYFMNMPTFFMSLSSSVGSWLTTLGISGCRLSSSTIRHLRNMTSLVFLDLSFNHLTKGIPKSLGNLCNLRELHLSFNNFGEISLLEILKTIFECRSSKLESLDIVRSNVSGHLPKQIGKFHNLVILHLSYNLLSGPIPYSIGNLSSLRSLDISHNQLRGSLPPGIGQLCELETMNVENNTLSGMVTEDHFAKLTKLKELSANWNNLTLEVHFANWVPPFQLQVLGLNSWNLGTRFPLWLQSQTQLQELDISSTRISDIIPNCFWTTFSNLSSVDLSSNQIQGTISKFPPKVSYVGLSDNKFSGPLPKIPPTLFRLDLCCNNLSGPLPNIPQTLVRLDLSSNNFSGHLPMYLNSYYLDLSSNSISGSLKHMCHTMAGINDQCYLNLSNNKLSGVIPQCWEDRKVIEIIDLENNNLSGEIPTSLGHLSRLQYLNMHRNKLVGKLPVSLMNLTSLKVLDLSQNKLTGNIPSWLGRRLTNLTILLLHSNRFSGDVSLELCHLLSLRVLDLSHNSLTGDVPRCFNNFHGMSRMDHVDSLMNVGEFEGSATIFMRGREDPYFSTLGLVTMLDLSNNHFSGPIPDELMSLKELRSMSLSRNRLTGRIPDKIGDMKQIEYLDLSYNQLQGYIPVSLSDLNSLSHLNLSYNNLTGRIPTSTQIQGLDNSSFIGNTLCGPPLSRDCGNETHDHVGRGKKLWRNTSHGIDWGFIISILLGFAIGFWAVVGPLILNRSWRITYFRNLYKVWSKFYDVCVYIC